MYNIFKKKEQDLLKKKSRQNLSQGLYADLEKLKNSWSLKIGQKVMENRKNLKKTWKSHGMGHPVKN
jgi:hypothetical protein